MCSEFSNGAIGGTLREGRLHVPDRRSGCVYPGQGYLIYAKLPSHFGNTYDMLRVGVLSIAWGTERPTLKGMTSSGKARGTWSNQSVRVQISHCTNRPASPRLPHPYENFRQGHLNSTTLFWLISFGKLLKQQSAPIGCVSVFRSHCHSLCCAIYMLLNFGSL